MGLAAFQALDAVACAIPLEYIKRDLDRLGCPPKLQKALPLVKAASALGLLVGARQPVVAAVTATALVAYFGAAVGFHVRNGDPVVRSLPAVAMGALAAGTLHSSRRAAA